jgi:hypothetical protein
MSYQLFQHDPKTNTRRRIAFEDLDNKAFWCKLGEQKELAFVQTMKKIKTGYTIDIHPAKAHNPYHPDLQCTDSDGIAHIAEVKIKNSPLFMAQRYGIDPQFACTMDLKDSFNYSRLLDQGIDLIIFIWVRWDAHEMVTAHRTYHVRPMRGLWKIPFSRLREHERSEFPPIHWYKESFRQPPLHPAHTPWAQQLFNFEPRLQQPDQQIKNISAKGVLYPPQQTMGYPAGQSSCSYVFDLSRTDLFETIIHRWDDV